jgi:hypothetical protein
MTTSRFLRLSISDGRSLALATVLAIAAGSPGCAGASGSIRPRTLDVRGTALVSDREPRMLIEGPARLLHVDVDGKPDVALFRVPHQSGSPADCSRPGVSAAADSLVRSGTNHVNLEIGADEAVCFAVRPTGDRSQAMNVSWHARARKTMPLLAANLEIARQP